MPRIALVLLTAALLAPGTALGQPRGERPASLQGVEEGRGVFLVDFESPRKTALAMKAIAGTHGSLEGFGAAPDLVVVYIGPTVRFLSTAPPQRLQQEQGEHLAAIRSAAGELKALGVRMEVCATSARLFDVDTGTILPEMQVVGDGFVSTIGWQARGWHLVPLF